MSEGIPSAGAGVEQAPARPQERVAARLASLREEAKALARVVQVLAPLGRERSWADLAKVPALVDKLEAKAAAIPGSAGRGAEIAGLARAELEGHRARLREGLARELRDACAQRGLSMRVLRREEPVELRIPPLGLRIDREKGRAELSFARLVVESAPAEAGAILAARERALAALTSGFDAARFFEAARKAWLAARAAAESAGERVEITDFLPQLALQLQKPAFRVDPRAKSFSDYPRARFAYDLLQLRRAGKLAQNGWRLNLGVATGTSATQKQRVLFVEDEEGEGEFKLTVFFTRVEESGGGAG